MKSQGWKRGHDLCRRAFNLELHAIYVLLCSVYHVVYMHVCMYVDWQL